MADRGDRHEEEPAAAIIAACRVRGLTLATAESLTAGLVASTLARIPGCSDVLLGGVVAYAPQVKERVLGVPAALLEHVVSAEVAEAMAAAACRTLGADLGIGTTGAAGPERLDGQPPGTVYIAAHLHGRSVSRRIEVPGERNAVRAQAAREALELALQLALDHVPDLGGP